MVVDELALMMVRLALASVFLMAGWLKLREGRAFVETVRSFGILPRMMITPFGRTLPGIEFLVGIALFLGVFIQSTALLGTALILSFLLASVWVIKKGLNLRCDCFGLLYRERIGNPTIGRDLVLLALALMVAMSDTGRFAAWTLIGESLNAEEVAAMSLTAMLFVASMVVAFRASGGLPVRFRSSRKQSPRAYRVPGDNARLGAASARGRDRDTASEPAKPTDRRGDRA